MNYITGDEMVNYYDARRVLELASDTGVGIINAGLLAANTVVLTAIRQASSMLDSHLQTGQRYERTQLEDIVTAANSGSATDAEKKRAEPIKSLVAHLTFGFLMSRRGFAADKMRQLAPQYDEALENLNKLSSGLRIFDLDGPKAAGVPGQVALGGTQLKWSQYSQMFGVFPTSPSGYLYPQFGE